MPQILFPATFGYRTDVAAFTTPDDLCHVFDLVTFPGMRSLEGCPKKNLESALRWRGAVRPS